MPMKSLILLLLFLAAPSLAEQPRLVFQQIQVAIAHHDNRFSLRVWPDGRAEMRFPPYTTYAGHYQWQLDADQLAMLDASLQAVAQLDLSGLQARKRSQASSELIEIADADWLRLEYRDDHQTQLQLVMESAQAWDSAMPGIRELAELAQLQATLFDWMLAAARELKQ